MGDLWVNSAGDMLNGNCKIVREKFSFTFRKIDNTLQLRATLRNGRYSKHGGYPLYLVTSDGDELCFECARAEYKLISWSIRNKANDGWRVVGCGTNYESIVMCCAHCSGKIESAHGDDK